MSYNYIYKELVQDNSDAVGIFAYAIYKQHKIDFINKIQLDESREPTDEELNSFHRSSMAHIEGYRIQGEALIANFLTESLAQRVNNIEKDVENAVIGNHLNDIKALINSEKTWTGWVKDVLSNLSVNILTILLIGAVIIGYHAFGDFLSKTEAAAGVTNQVDKQK